MTSKIFNKELTAKATLEIYGGMLVPSVSDDCEALFEENVFNKNIGWCGSGPGGSDYLL